MLAKIGAIIVDFWQSLNEREKAIIVVLNVAFLAVFFFGVPKAGILVYAIGGLLIEAVYLGLVYFVKTRILES